MYVTHYLALKRIIIIIIIVTVGTTSSYALKAWNKFHEQRGKHCLFTII